jgi:epoxyqueuosine reductase
LRNAAIALGNWGDERAIAGLRIALSDEESLVRGHAAWALGRIRTRSAIALLQARRRVEEDAWVRQEIEQGLSQ